MFGVIVIIGGGVCVCVCRNYLIIRLMAKTVLLKC